MKFGQITPPHEKLADFIYEDPDNSAEGLIPEVKEYLLEVVDRVDEAKPMKDLEWEDVVVVGSILGYQWYPESDIDLHFLVNFKKYADRHGFSVQEARDIINYFFKYLNLRGLYSISGHPIEFYFQGHDEKNESPAIYSLYQDKFLKFPQKVTEYDERAVEEAKKDATYQTMLLDELMASGSRESVNEWFEGIRQLRRSAIANEGVFSYGNMVFKFLRRWGEMRRAWEFINKYEFER